MISPLLSIIILSYNTKDITLNCLDSILKDKGLDFKQQKNSLTPAEIIIVDNNSTDGSPQAIKDYFQKKGISNYHLITNRQNLGFGKANNQGLKIAQGNYILFLNSDTLILHSAISQALDWLSSHPEVVTCTAQLLNYDKTIQPSGGFFPNLANVFTWCTGLDDLPLINKIIPPLHPHPPHFYTHDTFYQKDHPQDWVTGAFMLTRKSIIDKVGGYDEKYFMYGEELELSYRLKKTFPQHQTWYLVGPQIIHLGGASAVSKLDPILNEYRGIISFFQKHRSNWQLNLVKFLLKSNAFLRSIIYKLVGNQNTANLYQQACSKI
jgi:hypothetical protein